MNIFLKTSIIFFLLTHFLYSEINKEVDFSLIHSKKNSFREIILQKNLFSRPQNLPCTYLSKNKIFKLHYTTTGSDAVPNEITNPDNVPDWIYFAAQYAEKAHIALMDSLGFTAPPQDTISGEQFDIYFLNLGNGNYGYTYYASTPDLSTNRKYDYISYLEIDNDLVGSAYYTQGFDALKVTIAHEFFHCVQLGYNFHPSEHNDPVGMSEGDRYFLEWCSTWFEEFSYPEVNDYVNYSTTFSYYPNNYIWSNSYYYSHGIFLKYIIDNYSTNILIKTWNRIKNGERAFYALEKVIKDETNTTLAELYNKYCQRMYFSGPKYDKELSVSDDAVYFPSMQIHWSDEYTFDSTLQINDFIKQFSTQPIQITFENSRNFGILEEDDFSKDLLGSYVFNKNGKYSTGTFDLESDNFIGKCSPDDTLLLFLTNKDENVGVDFDITLDFVEPQNLFEFVNLFPNPTDGNGNLNLSISTKNIEDEIKINIFNLIGQKIFSRQYASNSDNLYTISFQNDLNYPIASGIYILQVEAGNKSKTRKFTILK